MCQADMHLKYIPGQPAHHAPRHVYAQSQLQMLVTTPPFFEHVWRGNYKVLRQPQTVPGPGDDTSAQLLHPSKHVY
jgi:hypothetical protein